MGATKFIMRSFSRGFKDWYHPNWAKPSFHVPQAPVRRALAHSARDPRPRELAGCWADGLKMRKARLGISFLKEFLEGQLREILHAKRND